MSILKRIGKVLGGMVLVFSIMSFITINALVGFTEYDTLKPIFIDVIGGQAQKQISEIDRVDITDEELYQFIVSMCQNQDTIVVPLEELGEASGFGGMEMITIDCDEFRDMPEQGVPIMDYVVENVGESFFDQYYYEEYDCDFIECIQQGKPYVIMSAKGNEFFESIKFWPFVGIALGVAVIYLASEGWTDFMKGLGWPLVFLGISYLIMGSVENLVVGSMPIASEAEQAGIDIMGPVDAVLKPIMDNLLTVFVLGVLLTSGGYIIEYIQKRSGVAKGGRAPEAKVKATAK